MSFEQFLTNNILPIIAKLITWAGQVLNTLMNNYIFMIIMYLGIIMVIIGVIKSIVEIILSKTNKTQKDKGN